MVDLVRTGCQEVDMTTWGWGIGDKIEGMIGDAVTQVFREMVDGDEPLRIYLRRQYDKEAKPLAIVVGVPLGSHEGDNVLFEVDTEALVDEVTEFYEPLSEKSGEGTIVDEEGRECVAAIRDELRRLADKLDKRL